MAADQLVAVHFNPAQVLRASRKLRRKWPRVQARAINKSARSTRTAMVKAVRQNVGGLKAGEVRKAIEYKKAHPNQRHPNAQLWISKKRLTLGRFGVRQFSYGVRARLKGGAVKYPGAFVRRLDGHEQALRRLEQSRYPVAVLRGPSLAQAFAAEWSVGRKRYKEQIRKNLAHEIKFALKR